MNTPESKALGYKFWHGDDHIRTEEENNAKLEGLIKIHNVFKKYKVDMFLSAGTLLGAVRNNDFIPWDWNVSVSYRAEDLKNRVYSFAKDIQNSGFVVTITAGNKCVKLGEPIDLNGYVRLNCYYKNNYFQIENCILKGKYRTRPRHKADKKYMEKTEFYKIRGIEFPCLNESINYLDWYYNNDWKIPKKIRREQIINKEARI